MATKVIADTSSVQTLTDKTLIAPVITSPVLSGTATGTYTLGGTPTISTPTINTPTMSTPTVTGILTVAGQIAFPATHNPSTGSNTLDDYEEGTFTPSIGGTATYTTQIGSYTKIGRVVFYVLQLTINVIGTGSTSTISGLPFTATTFDYPVNVGFYSALSSTVTSLYGRVNSSATTIGLFGPTAASAGNNGLGSPLASSTSINISGFYMST